MNLIAYIDDSGSHVESERYVLAGIVLPDALSTRLEADWKFRLDSKPCISYYKASDVGDRIKGPFATMSSEQRALKVNSLAGVLADNEPLILAADLATKDFELLRSQCEFQIICSDPYFFLFYRVIALMAEVGRKWSNANPVTFVFDNQGALGNKVRSWYPMFRSLACSEIQKLLGSEPRFEDEKLVIQLQVADMVAWHYRRAVIGDIPDYSKPLWDWFERSCTSVTFDYASLLQMGKDLGQLRQIA